jgi:hypothetical protein
MEDYNVIQQVKEGNTGALPYLIKITKPYSSANLRWIDAKKSEIKRGARTGVLQEPNRDSGMRHLRKGIPPEKKRLRIFEQVLLTTVHPGRLEEGENGLCRAKIVTPKQKGLIECQ